MTFAGVLFVVYSWHERPWDGSSLKDPHRLSFAAGGPTNCSFFALAHPPPSEKTRSQCGQSINQLFESTCLLDRIDGSSSVEKVPRLAMLQQGVDIHEPATSLHMARTVGHRATKGGIQRRQERGRQSWRRGEVEGDARGAVRGGVVCPSRHEAVLLWTTTRGEIPKQLQGWGAGGGRQRRTFFRRCE